MSKAKSIVKDTTVEDNSALTEYKLLYQSRLILIHDQVVKALETVRQKVGLVVEVESIRVPPNVEPNKIAIVMDDDEELAPGEVNIMAPDYCPSSIRECLEIEVRKRMLATPDSLHIAMSYRRVLQAW